MNSTYQRLVNGDARDLSFLPDESLHLDDAGHRQIGEDNVLYEIPAPRKQMGQD